MIVLVLVMVLGVALLASLSFIFQTDRGCGCLESDELGQVDELEESGEVDELLEEA